MNWRKSQLQKNNIQGTPLYTAYRADTQLLLHHRMKQIPEHNSYSHNDIQEHGIHVTLRYHDIYPPSYPLHPHQRCSVNRPVRHIPYQSLPAVNEAFVLAFGAELVNPVIYLELDFQDALARFSFRPPPAFRRFSCGQAPVA